MSPYFFLALFLTVQHSHVEARSFSIHLDHTQLRYDKELQSNLHAKNDLSLVTTNAARWTVYVCVLPCLLFPPILGHCGRVASRGTEALVVLDSFQQRIKVLSRVHFSRGRGKKKLCKK